MDPKEATATASPPFELGMTAQQAYLVLARALRQLSRRVLALWPVPWPSSLGEAPVALGKALAGLGATAGLVGPRDGWRRGHPKDAVSVSPVGEALDSLTPAWSPGTSVAAAIENTLITAGSRYARVLLDLSGLDLVEAQEVGLLPDVGTVLFVARGQIGEFALAKIARSFPQERVLGAVFMDRTLCDEAA